MNISRKDFLLTLAAAVGMTCLPTKKVYATPLNSANQQIAFSPSVALEIANMFAESNCADHIEAANPIPMYNANGSQVGWSVDYTCEGKPHGYIILDTEEDGLISRYCFQEGTSNILNEMKHADQTIDTFSNEEPSLVRISPLDFGILDTSTAEIIDRNGEISPLSSNSNSPEKTDWSSLMIDFDEIYSSYTVTGENYVGDYYFVSESQIEQNTGRYACAVTALYTIAGMTQIGGKLLLNPYSDYNEYNNIWNYTKTTVDHTKNGIQYGGTPMANIAQGFSDYCASKGYTQSNVSRFSPTYAQFQTQVSRHKHSVFSASITKPDGKISGHSMSVAGWATLKKGSSLLKTLNVYDGWSSLVFINTSFTGYVTTHGAFF